MLKKQNRLTSKFEFKISKKYGQKTFGQLCNSYVIAPKNYAGPTKIGIVIPNSLDKRATARNRLKRVYREVLRKTVPNLKNNFWIVIFPKSNSADQNYEKINADVIKNLQKIFLS